MEQKVVNLASLKQQTVDKVIQEEEEEPTAKIENIYLYFGISALVFAVCYEFLKK